MQAALQPLVAAWSAKGYAIGFGVGIAMGPAIVGTIGYEGRIDYTAIGNAVNLASRLCGLAKDYGDFDRPGRGPRGAEHDPAGVARRTCDQGF